MSSCGLVAGEERRQRGVSVEEALEAACESYMEVSCTCRGCYWFDFLPAVQGLAVEAGDWEMAVVVGRYLKEEQARCEKEWAAAGRRSLGR